MSTSSLYEHTTTIANIPALIVSETSRLVSERLGTIVLLHGLGGSRASHQTEARALASRGYVAVAIDAVGHGERRYRDFETRFQPENATKNYFETVERTVAEFPNLLTEIRRQKLSECGKIGAFGYSMGGAVLFGAVAQRSALDAVAIVASSPKWRGLEKSPHQCLERFFPTPLLVQTAEADTVVAPREARDFCETLHLHYAKAAHRLRYLEYPNEQHMFSEAGWASAWTEVLNWFSQFLNALRFTRKVDTGFILVG